MVKIERETERNETLNPIERLAIASMNRPKKIPTPIPEENEEEEITEFAMSWG